jgi:hypothetical protein
MLLRGGTSGLALRSMAGPVRAYEEKAEAMLTECEPQRMFVRCSYLNVRTFSPSVRRTAALFSRKVR